MNKKFRSTDELINEIASPMASPNGVGYERAKAELTAKLAQDIKTSLDTLNLSIVDSSRSSENLGKKIFWLNIILALATSVGAIATAFIAYKG
jgi:hypothetical protein